MLVLDKQLNHSISYERNVMAIVDILSFADSHSLGAVVSVCLLSVLISLVWRTVTKIHRFIVTVEDRFAAQLRETVRLLDAVKENHEELHEHVVKTAQDISAKYWKACQEMRCPKMDMLATKFEEQNRCLHTFVEDGKQARKRTQETLDRMDQTISTFVNDVGRAILRWLREGRPE